MNISFISKVIKDMLESFKGIDFKFLWKKIFRDNFEYFQKLF